MFRGQATQSLVVHFTDTDTYTEVQQCRELVSLTRKKCSPQPGESFPENFRGEVAVDRNRGGTARGELFQAGGGEDDDEDGNKGVKTEIRLEGKGRSRGGEGGGRVLQRKT